LFRSRRLVSLEAGELVALELIPGTGGTGPRQGAHLDLGVWRLDAPEHPEGSAALDEVRLQQMLARASTLRVGAPAEPAGEALRRIRLERARGGGAVEIELHPDCVARVDDQAGTLDERTCQALAGDLLFDDPGRGLLRLARRVETDSGAFEPGPHDTWVPVDGADVGDDLPGRLEAARSVGLVRGKPPSATRERVRVIPREGAPVTVELGQGWLRLDELPWYYRLK
jgi:hypothetical protein